MGNNSYHLLYSSNHHQLPSVLSVISLEKPIGEHFENDNENENDNDNDNIVSVTIRVSPWLKYDSVYSACSVV
jgi:hypothetical protein